MKRSFNLGVLRCSENDDKGDGEGDGDGDGNVSEFDCNDGGDISVRDNFGGGGDDEFTGGCTTVDRLE